MCILGVQHSISMFFNLQNSSFSFEMNGPPLFDLFFSGISYKFSDNKIFTSFVSEVLQTFTVGRLRSLSTAISFFSPFNVWLCNFPVKATWLCYLGSDNVFSFPLLFFDIWLFIFSPDARQAMHALTFLRCHYWCLASRNYWLRLSFCWFSCVRSVAYLAVSSGVWMV